MLIDIIDHADSPKPAHPASTVVLLRDGSTGVECLMIRRSSKTAFGGMWAFPGGRIEDEDIPAGTEPDPLPAARRAAARETAEEVGLAIDEHELVFLSHWLPPTDAPVRFSTWFFTAAAPAGEVAIDQNEVNDHRWFNASDALAAQRRGEIELVTPTFVTLVKLTSFQSAAAAVGVAEPEFFATRLAKTASGARVCLYEGDVAYRSGDCEAPGPRRRLTIDNEAGWRWDETDAFR